MVNSRDAFLERVRKAVASGNRAGIAHPLPERNGVGYQGGGPDPLSSFQNEWTLAGGQFQLLPDAHAARAKVLDLIHAHQARKILLGRDPLVLTLNLREFLQGHGVEIVAWSEPEALATGENEAVAYASGSAEPFFAADIGISGVDYLIAETGTVVMRSSPNQPRSISLLPPVHIALAERRQLVPDLFDLFEQLGTLPSCLTLITGPSKTGDIELRLVTGVHGPGTVHVLMLDS